MTTSEIIKALRDMLPPQVDYAELVGSPVPSSYGIHYVWEDPEPYILNEAANKLEALLSDIECTDKCDVCRNSFSDEKYYHEGEQDWFPRQYKCDSCFLGDGEQNNFEWRECCSEL